MLLRRLAAVAAVAVILPLGPYDIILLNTPRTPTAKGTARLVWAQSPFGVTVTADGRASYDVQLSLTGLPEPSTLGAYTTYVAWAATTNLDSWHRLGTVKNGISTVGKVELKEVRQTQRNEARTDHVLHRLAQTEIGAEGKKSDELGQTELT